MLRNIVGVGVVSGALFVGYHAAFPELPPPFPPIPVGKTRICMTGYSTGSPPSAHAHQLADKIANTHAEKYETYYYWSNFGWGRWSCEQTKNVKFPEWLKGHCTSPFVFLQTKGGEISPIGGDSEFVAWAKKNFDGDEAVMAAVNAPVKFDLWHGWKLLATCTKYENLYD